jgi:hypothetical protein
MHGFHGFYDFHIPFVTAFLGFVAAFAIVHWCQERRR